MTPKEAKAYLRQYRESLLLAKEITRHLGELKAEAISLKDHEGQRVKLDEATAKYMDACDTAAEELIQLASLRRKISDTIQCVKEPKLNLLLRLRYIDGMTFDQVAEEMCYSRRRVNSLHGDALKIVGAIL